MSQKWIPRRFRPSHLQIIRLHFQGMSNNEIAAMVGVTPQHVSNLLNTPEALEMLSQFQDKTLDTIMDIQLDAQAIAPAIFEEKVRLALTAKDERTRNTACSDILNIAGHMPVRRVVIEQPDRQAERFDKMTNDELRAEMLGIDESQQQAPREDSDATVH